MTDRKDPKENADVPPVLPNEKPPGAKAGGALSPEDLDFTDSPYVAEISDGRYVVSADKTPPTVPEEGLVAAEESHPARGGDPTETTPTRGGQRTGVGPQPGAAPGQNADAIPQSPEAARSILARELEWAEARYALDIVARFDDRSVRHRTATNDVVGTFDTLARWYAQNVSNNTPTDKALAILLARSDLPMPLSKGQLKTATKRHGLSRESTIGELIDALQYE